MLEASCHCGAVRLRVSEMPRDLTSCNCSICRRLATLWAYYPAEEVTFLSGAGKTVRYIHGARTIAFHHCPNCGCTTHWEGLDRGPSRQIAINGRLMDPDDIADVPVYRLDGADTWTYLD